jgi:hypothetical protein
MACLSQHPAPECRSALRTSSPLVAAARYSGPPPDTLSLEPPVELDGVVAGAESGPPPETLFVDARGPPPLTDAITMAAAARNADSMVYRLL